MFPNFHQVLPFALFSTKFLRVFLLESAKVYFLVSEVSKQVKNKHTILLVVSVEN